MTTHNLHPASGGGAGGNISNAGAWAPTGNATNWQATSDNSDASYMASGTPGLTVALAMEDYTLGAHERCLRIQTVVRAGSVPGDTISYQIGNVSLNDWTVADTPGVASGGAIVNLTGAQRANYPSAPGTEWTQTRLDNLNVRIWVTSSSTRIYQITSVLDVRTQPTVVAGVPTETNTHFPAPRWTTTANDGDVQSAFVVHVYDLDVNASPAFTDTNGLVYASGVQLGNATSIRVSTGLPDGSYRSMVQVAKDFNGDPWWSLTDSADFTVAVTDVVPTAVGVVSGTTNTNLPKLTAHVVGPIIGFVQSTAKAEWRLATDSGFTTNLRDVLALDTQLTKSGTVIATVPSDQALFQGTWFMQARTVDQFGSVSAWSATVTFVISHPPTTLNYSPTGGVSIAYDTGVIAFDWEFADSSPDDVQSAYQIIVVDPDGGTIVDSTKTTSLLSTGSVTIPAVWKDFPLRWKVRVWDVDDIVSSYSNYQSFSVADVPTATVTSPLAGGVVASPQPEIDWIFGAGGTRVQVAWRVAISISIAGVLTGIYDTNWQSGTDNTHVLTTPAMIVNGGTYIISVSVRDNTGLEGTTNVNVTTAWVAPDAPSFTIDATQYDTQGFISLLWDNSVEDGAWAAWRVYRRNDISTEYQLAGEIDEDALTFELDDYLAPSNTMIDYVVVQVATRFGSLVESDRTGNEVQTTTGGTKYWLICEDDPTLSVRFDSVNTDDITDEYEEEEMLLFGRGRKVDQGTRWGYRSALVARLLDNDRGSARQQRLNINALRKAESICAIRTPFGDVIRSVLGDVAFTRDAGVGLMESGTITIPYVEVAE